MVSLCGRGFDSLQLHFVSPSRGLTLVRVLCIANIWYAQPLEAFFRRKTFLRFLRFLRDHYFSRRVYSTQKSQKSQKLYLLCKYLVCTLQEHFSEGKHFCAFYTLILAFIFVQWQDPSHQPLPYLLKLHLPVGAPNKLFPI